MHKTLIAALLLSFPLLASAQWSYWQGDVSTEWERVDPIRDVDLSLPPAAPEAERAHVVVVPQRPPRVIPERDRRFWRPVSTLGEAAPTSAP